MGGVEAAPRLSDRRLFVPADRLAGPRLTLTGAPHQHLARVLRARVGDRITVFDGAGGELDAQVVRVGRAETEIELGGRQIAAAPAVAITLLCAVPRGPRMDLLVQKTCELGVARLVPVVADRSLVRPVAEASRRARWERIAQEASRQSGRADVPIIDAPLPLAAALESSTLPARRLALVERTRDRSLRTELAGKEPAATALLVGPEGGFATGEVEATRRAGFLGVSLGSRILRVETAAIVGVALVAAASGMLD